MILQSAFLCEVSGPQTPGQPRGPGTPIDHFFGDGDENPVTMPELFLYVHIIKEPGDSPQGELCIYFPSRQGASEPPVMRARPFAAAPATDINVRLSVDVHATPMPHGSYAIRILYDGKQIGHVPFRVSRPLSDIDTATVSIGGDPPLGTVFGLVLYSVPPASSTDVTVLVNPSANHYDGNVFATSNPESQEMYFRLPDLPTRSIEIEGIRYEFTFQRMHRVEGEFHPRYAFMVTRS